MDPELETPPGLPPLTPRKTALRRPPGGPDIQSITKISIPAGNELLIRGVIDPSSKRARQNSTAYVQRTIEKIMEKDKILQLSPVVASAFSTQDNIPSVYISFTNDFIKKNPEPRYDSMELWKGALQSVGEPW